MALRRQNTGDTDSDITTDASRVKPSRRYPGLQVDTNVSTSKSTQNDTAYGDTIGGAAGESSGEVTASNSPVSIRRPVSPLLRRDRIGSGSRNSGRNTPVADRKSGDRASGIIPDDFNVFGDDDAGASKSGLVTPRGFPGPDQGNSASSGDRYFQVTMESGSDGGDTSFEEGSLPSDPDDSDGCTEERANGSVADGTARKLKRAAVKKARAEQLERLTKPSDGSRARFDLNDTDIESGHSASNDEDGD
jgi:hypothetical protein